MVQILLEFDVDLGTGYQLCGCTVREASDITTSWPAVEAYMVARHRNIRAATLRGGQEADVTLGR